MERRTPLAPPLSVHLPWPGWRDRLGFSADAVMNAEQLGFTPVAPRALTEACGQGAFIAYVRPPEPVWTDAALPLEPGPGIDAPCHSYMTLGAYVASLPSAVLRPDRGLCYLSGGRLWADCLYLASTESIESDKQRIGAGDLLRPVLPGLSLALNNGPYTNYYHWHLDCLTGLQLMVEHAGPEVANVVSGPLAPWQREAGRPSRAGGAADRSAGGRIAALRKSPLSQLSRRQGHLSGRHGQIHVPEPRRALSRAFLFRAASVSSAAGMRPIASCGTKRRWWRRWRSMASSASRRAGCPMPTRFPRRRARTSSSARMAPP